MVKREVSDSKVRSSNLFLGKFELADIGLSADVLSA